MGNYAHTRVCCVYDRVMCVCILYTVRPAASNLAPCRPCIHSPCHHSLCFTNQASVSSTTSTTLNPARTYWYCL